MGKRYEKYKQQAGVLAELKFLLAWCPKYRRPVLVDGVASRLREIVSGKAVELGIKIWSLDIEPDKLQLLVSADQTYCPAEIVTRLKRESSHRLRHEFPELKSRLPTLWNRDYFAVTVGGADLSKLDLFWDSQKRTSRRMP